jgi:hypothetical protein
VGTLQVYFRVRSVPKNAGAAATAAFMGSAGAIQDAAEAFCNTSFVLEMFLRARIFCSQLSEIFLNTVAKSMLRCRCGLRSWPPTFRCSLCACSQYGLPLLYGLARTFGACCCRPRVVCIQSTGSNVKVSTSVYPLALPWHKFSCAFDC